MDYNINEEMLEVRQFILEIFNGIPDPKRILANVLVVDRDTDEQFKVDYVIFTSNGPFAIFLKPKSLKEISYREFVLKEFLLNNQPISYFPAFGYFPTPQNSVLAFSSPEELTQKIVNRIFGCMPSVHEQISYEHYLIIEQYTEENFENTMKALSEMKQQDIEKTENEVVADIMNSSNQK